MNLDCEEFERLVIHLNYRWRLYKDLFQDSKQYVLFNESGSNVWSVFRESLLDSIFMDISRLFDPKSSFKKDNLTISRMIDRVSASKYEDVLGDNLTESIILYKRLILPWRNQRLSHNDLNTITGKSQLPDVPLPDIEDLISKINQIARFILLCYDDADRGFIPSVIHKAWTPRLFRVLGSGIAALKE